MTQEQINAAFIRRVERITGTPTSADAVGERELEDVRTEAELWLEDSGPMALYDLLREAEARELKRQQHANVVRAVEAVMAKLTREHPLHAELCAALYVPIPQRPLTAAEKAHALSLFSARKEGLMKPLTMTEEEERVLRDRCAGAMPLGWTGAARDCQSAWTEVDALRAKLAEVERQYDVLARNGINAIRLNLDEVKRPEVALALAKHDLAASQEREREMREAAKGLTMAMRGWGAEDDGIPETWMPEVEFAQQCLARPTDDSALRGLCACAWIAGAQANNNPFDGGVIEPGDWHDRAAKYVNEVLGPGAAPIAAEINEKE